MSRPADGGRSVERVGVWGKSPRRLVGGFAVAEKVHKNASFKQMKKKFS